MRLSALILTAERAIRFFPTFCLRNANKMKSASPDVRAYFEALENNRREQLGALRSHIKHVWPDAAEDFYFRMPTYHIEGKPAFAIASHKTHMAFHVIVYDLLAPFKHELLRFECGRSCIRFKAITPEVTDLLDRLIKYVGSQVHLSTRSARPTSHARTVPLD